MHQIFLEEHHDLRKTTEAFRWTLRNERTIISSSKIVTGREETLEKKRERSREKQKRKRNYKYNEIGETIRGSALIDRGSGRRRREQW